MEDFDVVNENDEVIGVTTKEKSHQNGDIHCVVAVYCFTPDGRLYVQEHLKSGGKFDHSVGGHVRKGEEYDTAAAREALEELNIASPLKKIDQFYSDESSRGSPIRHMFGLYECIVPEDWQFVANEEVKKVIPMEVQDIIFLMSTHPERFTTGFIHTMRQYIRKRNRDRENI